MMMYALVSGWMALAWSEAVWATLPLLNYFQFPARWIGFAGFGLAWLAAIPVGLVARRAQPLVAAAICLFLMATALVYLYPDKTPPGTRVMSPYDVVRYEVKSGAIGTTSYGEFNPRWAPRPLPQSPMVEDYMARQPVDRLKGMLPEDASHTILSVTAHRQQYAITLAAPATSSINLLYFPGWAATVNGQAVEIWPQEGTGLITLALPAGENVLDLRFGPTPLRRAMGVLSSGAWILFVLALVVVQLRRPSVPAPTLPASHNGLTLASIGVVACGVLALQIVGASWFQLRSPPDQALVAPVPRHDDVGEHFRLLGQNLVPDTVRAGATLPVVAYWRSIADMDENYAVVLRLQEVGSGQTLVEMEQSHPNDIPTSGWATGLYVRNEWQLPVPAEALPLQYALRIGFRDPATGAMLPTAGGDSLELGRVWVLPKDEPTPTAGPSTRFGEEIELLGATTDVTTLTLYWRANAPIPEDYAIFVHLLDANGQMLGQLDGLPFGNRYPTTAWRPGQIIEDRREIAASGLDPAQVDAVAVGIYHPVTGERLRATDEAGNALVNNAVVIAKSAGR